MFSLFSSACTGWPKGKDEDDSCLQIAHQLKQFLTMLPSQYFDIFVSKKLHIDRNHVSHGAVSRSASFAFLLKSIKKHAQR
ncbi:MAG: hypothetical protein I4O49_06550 [Janthinobacterium lividum]|nr:hypothetical protein [Janthinobacterium lividum]